MKRGSIVAIVFVIALSAAGGWYAMSTKRVDKEQSSAQSTDSIQENLDEAIGLALKGINLVQGEKGIELWRLKATWAALHQEEGFIDVKLPDMVYRVGDAETPLHVTAAQGEIEQDQKNLRLWGDVVCTYEDSILTSSLMTYDGKSRVMTFPEGATITGPSAHGFAEVLTWDLTTNIIDGQGGVKVSW